MAIKFARINCVLNVVALFAKINPTISKVPTFDKLQKGCDVSTKYTFSNCLLQYFTESLLEYQ